MTTYEIIMVFLGIISLLICFGQLLIALLTFLDNKRNKKRKNNAYPAANKVGGVR